MLLSFIKLYTVIRFYGISTFNSDGFYTVKSLWASIYKLINCLLRKKTWRSFILRLAWFHIKSKLKAFTYQRIKSIPFTMHVTTVDIHVPTPHTPSYSHILNPTIDRHDEELGCWFCIFLASSFELNFCKHTKHTCALLFFWCSNLFKLNFARQKC